MEPEVLQEVSVSVIFSPLEYSVLPGKALLLLLQCQLECVKQKSKEEGNGSKKEGRVKRKNIFGRQLKKKSNAKCSKLNMELRKQTRGTWDQSSTKPEQQGIQNQLLF